MKNSIIKLGALGVASMLLSINVDAADVEINFTEYTLDNGLRLVVHEDNKAPIVAINVWYHVGSKNEKRGKPVSHTCSNISCSTEPKITMMSTSSHSNWSAPPA